MAVRSFWISKYADIPEPGACPNGVPPNWSLGSPANDTPGTSFYHTNVCRSGLHCETCRDPEGGKSWRQQQAKVFNVDGKRRWFNCDYGKQWRWTPGGKSRGIPGVTDVVIEHGQGPGDMCIFTGALRDLHVAHPGKFRTAVVNKSSSSTLQLLANNPYVSERRDLVVQQRSIKVHVTPWPDPLSDPIHFAAQFRRNLGAQLKVDIPVIHPAGSIYLSKHEESLPSPVQERTGYAGKYIAAFLGGKGDFEVKWWPSSHCQKFVDLMRDAGVTVVRLGVRGGSMYQPELSGENLIEIEGLSHRELVRVMYRASGGVGPVSYGMHLAAAVPTVDGGIRPYVVLGGGAESPTFYKYPGQISVNTIGKLDCCASHGCFRKPVGRPFYDIEIRNNRSRCDLPQLHTDGRQYAKCMEMVSPEAVAGALLSQMKKASNPAWVMHDMTPEKSVERFGAEARRIQDEICKPCPEFHSAFSPGVTYCKAQPRTCSCPQGTGIVSIRVGKCPQNKFEKGIRKDEPQRT